MKLRTQILLVLLAFALLPLMIIMASNFPRVLDMLGSLNRELYLQDLRSDFRDLDQHLVSRQEMLKLLAKLPEPHVMLGQVENEEETEVDAVRTRYTEWINRILPDQLDVIEIQFLDNEGDLRFWLERDRQTTEWNPTLQAPVLPESQLINETLLSQRIGVNISKVRLRPEQKSSDPRRFMNLNLAAPMGIVPELGAVGVVVMTVDIGGMARRFTETFWAYDDGRYLEVSRKAETGSTAYVDFPGIDQSFPEGKPFLWTDDDNKQQVIWVPLIQTESSGPLWAGRVVDASPVADLSTQLILRVGGMILALMLIAWLVARWLAQRADEVGYEFTDGITRLLEDDEKVVFKWTWTDELKSLSDKLTRLAAKHIANNKQLIRHTRELEESNRYKSQFLANVSHELRTPLNSILLLSKMLADRETALPRENAEQAKVIHKAGKDLQLLIEDILDLSKIEARKASLNLENVNLPALLEDLVKLMQPQFDEKQLFLELNIDRKVAPTINTDPDKLRQILKNFLSNAVKFTDKGGVTVSLCAIEDAHSSTLPVCISIRDTGIGIPPEKQSLIFQAFKQADGSTSRRFGGTGLGLSISQELAHLLGGHIELQSEAGKGADFRLRLPLVFDRETIIDEQLGVDEPAIDSGQLQALNDKIDFNGFKVLIIESDVPNLLSLTTLLESWSLTVTGAGDIEEALEVLEEETFSAILIDVKMSSVDGYAALKKIREEYHCGELPIIALTGSHDDNEMQACMDGGANAYMVKPIDPAGLEKILKQFLENNPKS